ncbi:hypothetical protein [Oceanibaculum indicum]|uniref:YpeB-like protein with protease inhibitory function n=1 Tax=Oceanibaculum indicum TaxID=526216 RepID=A0A420WAJ5_9PROT|nr:hypothetical protein [Oceanibaculum indicum]RKQ68008.1 hypothetical protein BCL74_3325 [Oceanibaculum indicum]
MRVLILAALLLTAAVPQARAEEPSGNPVETLREGMAKAVEALRDLAEEVQRYGVPYFDKDGNIVIPRKAPDEGVPDTADTGQAEARSITL